VSDTKRELIDYVKRLTKEQAEKIIADLPKLREAISKQALPCHQGQTEQTR
jgi:hypothetical protein